MFGMTGFIVGVRTSKVRDPQDGTTEDTFDHEDFLKLMKVIMLNGSVESSRDMAFCAFMHNSVGR